MAIGIKELTSGIEELLGTHPFMVEGEMAAYCSAAAKNLYGCNRPEDAKRVRITLDGTTTVFHEDDYPELAALHDDGGALTVATQLRIVVLELGAGDRVLRLLTRVQSDDTPVDGEFLAVDNTGMQLELGDAGNEGTDIQIWVNEATDVGTAALTQYTPNHLYANRVVVADNAVTLERLP